MSQKTVPAAITAQANALEAFLLNSGISAPRADILAYARRQALDANEGSLRRFLAQFELLSGGPEEYGYEDYTEVVETAARNIFTAQALVAENDLCIELGPYIVRSKADEGDEDCKDGFKYWNNSFGWTNSRSFASGFLSDDKDAVVLVEEGEYEIVPFLNQA